MKSYVILDRSGSMSDGWDDTIGGLQTYLDRIDPKVKLHFLAFDTEFLPVVSGTRVKDINLAGAIRDAKVFPRGTTALLDAIGVMAATVDQTAKKRAQIVILTDGRENASEDVTKDHAAKIIAGWKEKGYDVVFLGADFDAFGEARQLGIGAGQTLNMKKGFASSRNVGETLANRATAYADSGDNTAQFSDTDRTKAFED